MVIEDPIEVPDDLLWVKKLDYEVDILKNTDVRSLLPIESEGKNFVVLKTRTVRLEKEYPSDFVQAQIAVDTVLSEILSSGDILNKQFEPGSQKRDWTVIEASTFDDTRFLTDDQRSVVPDPLTRCIEVLIDFYKVLRIQKWSPVSLLTYERLNPIVVQVREDLVDNRHRAELLIRLNHFNYGPALNARSISREEFYGMSYLADRLRNNDPFLQSREYRLNALFEFKRRGYYDQAIIQIAMSSEVLLSAIGRMILWEGASDGRLHISEVPSYWKGMLKDRIKKIYGRYLSTKWSYNSNAMTQWDERIVKIRNKVVHEGYYPSRIEILQAFQAADNLEFYLADCLEEVFLHFPKTSYCYIGRQDLLRRFDGCVLKFFLPTVHEEELHWLQSFHAWSQELSQNYSR
ncbi:hypothetical protein [Actinomyces vulturis]|uniref:hypothetical protein n=1 Tax=Actinomyces vulturis TaxID=1857645 RepID=UPI00159ED668|nr:hypothetical protein [Actinomyces vulturis]